MLKFLTKDNITFILAVIGSCGTLFFWIKSYFDNRVKLNFKAVEKLNDDDSLLLYIMLENCSRLTLSINQITVVSQNNKVNCVEIPTKVYTVTSRTGNEITDQQNYYSLNMPIVLNPLCGTAGYLYFAGNQFVPLDSSTELIVEFCTNRGKKVRKKLQLDRVPDLS